MSEKELYKKLRDFGLPLFSVENEGDANTLLVQMAKSDDLRLWEGFPVVLANVNQKNVFDYSAAQNYLKGKKDNNNFRFLIMLSLSLYQVLGLKFSWSRKLKESIGGNKDFGVFLGKLNKGVEFEFAGKKISPDRLKEIFTNYFSGQQRELQNLSRSKDEFSLEYALSQLFSPKQKELFLKKFRGQVLTKTEKEYYSRCVKKKALALANAELHKIAQQLI